MADWLKNRLTPAKQEVSQWQHLAEAIEQFWEENFDPEFNKAKNLRSLYTADEEGLQRILSELGGYYEWNLPEDNIPLAIAWRKIELLQKDSLVPILSALERLMPDVKFEWKVLYAKTGEPYGTDFYTDEELDPAWLAETSLYVDGTWKVGATPPVKLRGQNVYLTSRGRLEIDVLDSFAELEMWGESQNILSDRIRNTKPLHIVFAGYKLKMAIVLEPNAGPEFWEFQIIVSADVPYVSSGAWKLDGTLQLDGTWKITDHRLTTFVDFFGVDFDIPYAEEPLPKLDGTLQLDGTWKVCIPHYWAACEVDEFCVKSDLEPLEIEYGCEIEYEPTVIDYSSCGTLIDFFGVDCDVPYLEACEVDKFCAESDLEPLEIECEPEEYGCETVIDYSSCGVWPLDGRPLDGVYKVADHRLTIH